MSASTPAARAPDWAGRIPALWPGVLLCLAITALSLLLQRAEEHLTGHPYVEALVFALLLGVAVRTAWTPSARFAPGIAFSAKQVLEFAVALLGASISLGAILASGAALLAGIAATVCACLLASFALCRLLRLPPRMSILVACGNSICGNSAIAAVAPVIGADTKDVAAAISFTAVLGVLMVLGLPLLILPLGMTERQYGILAGMTVYAVPQVLAATVPVSLLATQVGTLTKLVRVLMLGPVVLGCSLLAPRLPQEGRKPGPARRPGFGKLVPWFITGFLALAALRSAGALPAGSAAPVTFVATVLTVLAMAALGLGVDIRILARVGARVTLAVTASLAVLLALALGLIHLLG